MVSVNLRANGEAIIIFDDIISAIFAQKIMNNREIPELQVKLKVTWEQGSDEIPNPIDLINFTH